VPQRATLTPVRLVEPGPHAAHEAFDAVGVPLDTTTQDAFSDALGYDLSRVRVHSGPRATERLDLMHADAMTFGDRIVLNDDPATTRGRQLLAHELVHVAQSQPDAGVTARTDVVDSIAEDEAHRGALALSREPNLNRFQVRHRFAQPVVAFQTKASEFPGFSQGAYETCGAASLISALMIWDKERHDPDNPNKLLVSACNTVLVYLDDHKQALIRGWDTISIKGQTGQGAALHADVVSEVTTVRDAAKAAKAQVTESQYQELGVALYILAVNRGSAGLTRAQIAQLQSTLGIGGGTQTTVSSFDQIIDALTGLKPGQIAQISWYSRGNSNPNGTVLLSHHAFLIGRFQRGTWFVSDQGAKPPVEIEAATLNLLKSEIESTTRTNDSGIHTGTVPSSELIPDTGVMILGDRAGVETKARNVIMTPGDFIAEVDAGYFTSGDRIVAWDFVARTYSLDDAKTEMAGAGTGSGGVIVENPIGLFHVFKTGLVRDPNVMETSIDEDDSHDGKLSKSPKRYYHAWLQLRSASKTGSFFQVY
jgi:hypothetical protein